MSNLVLAAWHSPQMQLAKLIYPALSPNIVPKEGAGEWEIHKSHEICLCRKWGKKTGSWTLRDESQVTPLVETFVLLGPLGFPMTNMDFAHTELWRSHMYHMIPLGTGVLLLRHMGWLGTRLVTMWPGQGEGFISLEGPDGTKMALLMAPFLQSSNISKNGR